MTTGEHPSDCPARLILAGRSVHSRDADCARRQPKINFQPARRKPDVRKPSELERDLLRYQQHSKARGRGRGNRWASTLAPFDGASPLGIYAPAHANLTAGDA